MAFVVGTFVLVMAIVYGLYWLFVERDEAEEQSALRKRLKRPTQKSVVTAALLRERERLSDMGAFDAVLARMGRVTDPMQRTLSQAGMNVTVGTVLLAMGCLGLLGYVGATWFLHMPLVSLLVGFAAAYLPYGIVKMKRTRRMFKFEEQFPEAIDLLARALRAGHALTTGLSMVGEEMADPVGPEFRLLFDQQNYGMPLPQAMKEFAERMPMIDARFFVTAVLTQRESGGNLSEVLDNLANIIRDRFRVKRQVRVISAHGRITGWVLSALPTCLGLFFALTSPEIYTKFYHDPFGLKMIMFALGMQVVGVLVIQRIVQIEY
ncbi:MAG: type II secretion system F family protein [Vicinamibacterales bacterium]